MNAFPLKNELIIPLAMVALLIGLTTGNAIVMAVISAIAMALIVVFGRTRLTYRKILIVFGASVAAFVIGLVVTLL